MRNTNANVGPKSLFTRGTVLNRDRINPSDLISPTHAQSRSFTRSKQNAPYS